MRSSLFVLLFSILMFESAQATIDLVKLESDLKKDGVVGYIHGDVPVKEMVVFTYRNPDDFFDNVQLPLISTDEGIAQDLLKTKRHQKVRIFGSFVEGKAPIKHIDVSKIVLIQDYTSDVDQKPYTYKGTEAEIRNQTSFTARVHAIDQEGKVLVVEYKDMVTPIFIKNQPDIDVVKGLYRGDKITVNYSVRKKPEFPLHIQPTSDSPDKSAITVVERIQPLHGQKATKEGYLVLFEKSPQILTDVYALLVEDTEGTNIQFTLANLEDPATFTKIRQKLEAAWKSNLTQIENGRNKLINRKIKVRATGTLNVVSQSQANPQILITDVDNLVILNQ